VNVCAGEIPGRKAAAAAEGVENAGPDNEKPDINGPPPSLSYSVVQAVK